MTHWPWHFHTGKKRGSSYIVYRDHFCMGINNIGHGKPVGQVYREAPRRWAAHLNEHLADGQALHGKGRTRNEAVASAIAKGGIPYGK